MTQDSGRPSVSTPSGVSGPGLGVPLVACAGAGRGRLETHIHNRCEEGANREYPAEDNEVLLFVGTCQSCGGYWDVRQRTICTCGGEVL